VLNEHRPVTPLTPDPATHVRSPRALLHPTHTHRSLFSPALGQNTKSSVHNANEYHFECRRADSKREEHDGADRISRRGRERTDEQRRAELAEQVDAAHGAVEPHERSVAPTADRNDPIALDANDGARAREVQRGAAEYEEPEERPEDARRVRYIKENEKDCVGEGRRELLRDDAGACGAEARVLVDERADGAGREMSECGIVCRCVLGLTQKMLFHKQ
jgi:hypothetical protein